MYETLLKWGLESLTKLTGLQGTHELQVILEAAKTKNAIVLERLERAGCHAVMIT